MFTCDICNYNTKKKSNFDRHLLTKKHKINIENKENKKKYICEKCNKSYKSYKYKQGLSRHKSKCINNNINSINKKFNVLLETINDMNNDIKNMKDIKDKNVIIKNNNTTNYIQNNNNINLLSYKNTDDNLILDNIIKDIELILYNNINVIE